jgi:hypothetical protein
MLHLTTYVRESSIICAAFGMTLSNNVSQSRASGQRDMTPKVTGTRRAFVGGPDHNSWTSVGFVYAVATYNVIADRMALRNIGAD